MEKSVKKNIQLLSINFIVNRINRYENLWKFSWRPTTIVVLFCGTAAPSSLNHDILRKKIVLACIRVWAVSVCIYRLINKYIHFEKKEFYLISIWCVHCVGRSIYHHHFSSALLLLLFVPRDWKLFFYAKRERISHQKIIRFYYYLNTPTIIE